MNKNKRNTETYKKNKKLGEALFEFLIFLREKVFIFVKGVFKFFDFLF
jgi:hypothetical protein